MALILNPLTGQFDFTGSGGAVSSVNGQTGVVVLDTDDISEGTTNQYFTDQRVQDADMGTFTGSIIPDNSSTKESLQELETAIETLPDPIVYQGTWDGSTNTPTLSNSDTGVTGYLYQVNVAGSVDFGAGSISFEIGDKVVNNGTIWEKWDLTDSVNSVNGQTGIVVLDTDDINEGLTNLYFTDERAQDAVGTILTDSSSIDFTYADATPSITAVVLPAGVNHNALQNYVANEHVDHTAVQIATAPATSGLTGGGTIAATRNLSVDIAGTTLETNLDNADLLLIYDNSATALKSMSRSDFLADIPIASEADLNEITFSLANNQASPVNVAGFDFTSGDARCFEALVSVEIDATAPLYEVFTLRGIQKNTSWDLSITANGDSSGIVFSITNSGQIQYMSSNFPGFSSAVAKFRAITTTA